MGGHRVSQGLIYAAGFYPKCAGPSDLKEPLIHRSSSDVSTGKLVKFYWGLFYDRLQIACKIIRVYDQIHLESISPENPSQEPCESSPTVSRVNKLYLGVMPRQSFGEQFNQLSRSGGQFTVVSFLEDFEHKEAMSIGDLIRVPSPDFEPVPVEKIQEAVEAISESIKKGNVYVHCKSGKGRSAVAVLGYVMKQLYNQDPKQYSNPEVCFRAAEELVTQSRNANTVRTTENEKAVVLLEWFKIYVVPSDTTQASAT
jgi:protein-tyrosine phosphatase